MVEKDTRVNIRYEDSVLWWQLCEAVSMSGHFSKVVKGDLKMELPKSAEVGCYCITLKSSSSSSSSSSLSLSSSSCLCLPPVRGIVAVAKGHPVDMVWKNLNNSETLKSVPELWDCFLLDFSVRTSMMKSLAQRTNMILHSAIIVFGYLYLNQSC